MRTTHTYTATHVWFVSDEPPQLQCGFCQTVFVSPTPYPNVDGKEFCPNCNEELLYPGWAEW